MARLPRVSGKDTVRALELAGFELVRVRGSHHMMRRPGQAGSKVIVPVHGSRTIAPGTLRDVLDKAGLSVDAFVDLL